MKKKHILLLLVVLLLALAIPASATQYNPPWAHNYGFLYPDGVDTRLPASNSATIQDLINYDGYYLSNYGALTGFMNFQDDAIFYVNGHGLWFGGETGGGGVEFYDGTTTSLLIAQYTDWLPPFDAYFLSDLSTELKDVLLAVYVACYSGRTCLDTGNLVDMSASKGVDNVIGFKDAIGNIQSNYWSDRFWYRCLYGGQGGSHQSFKYAASGAIGDVLIQYHGFYGLESIYSKYRYPYDYLDPARYGVV